VIRNIYYAIVPLLVLFCALLLSCTLGYFIVQGVGDAMPFRQILTRSTQLYLVLSIYPIARYLKISKKEFGFAPSLVFLKQLCQGFGIGFIVLIPIFIVLYAVGINVFDQSEPWTLERLANYMIVTLLVALLISVIEESLFRGIVIVGLIRKLPVTAAILLTSLYYAGLHFLSIKTNLSVPDIHFFSGFVLLGEALANVVNPSNQPAFLALLMVGIFLGVLRTQVETSLGLCIGCHTCWVWQIKMSKKLFNTNYDSDYQYLVSHYDGVIGPLVAAWLLVVVASYFIYRHMKKA
jgi:membrane protease YdiL (CAAX protease family)